MKYLNFSNHRMSSDIFYIIFACLCVSFVDCHGMLSQQNSESRSSMIVDGIWSFRADYSLSRNEGFDKKWWKRPLDQSGPVIEMPVPASFNDIGQNKSLRDFIGWVWYETETFVPSLWRSQRVVLRFDSVHYFAHVWVNGRHVTSHEGGHLPFEADVSGVVNFGGSNRITVAVNNTLSPTSLPPGEIQYMNNTDRYPNGYFIQWYQFDFLNYAGIHRSVTLYTTPKCYIDDITVTSNYSSTTGHVMYSVSHAGACSSVIGWQLEVEDADGLVVSRGTSSSGRFDIANVKLWWPVYMSERPGYQYTMRVRLKFNDDNGSDREDFDVYRQKFGVRTIGLSETKLFVNNRPFYCQGFGKHEDSDIRGRGLDVPLLVKDFNLMSWVGANCVRTTHYPYSEAFMDLADSHGIMIIDEAPAVGVVKPEFFGAASLAHHKEVMMELIRRDKNRPSVFMWSVSNEPGSALPESRQYFKSVIEYTRSLDNTRLVTFVVGRSNFWKDKVADFVDVLCVNHYYAWYSDTGDISLIRRQLKHNLDGWHQTFKKPVILSEYGADTVTGLHQDPSYVFTEEFQVDYIREHHAEFDQLRPLYLVGEMIWNFADFMTKQGITRVVGNRKGIFTRQRQPKMAAHVLRMRYQTLARNLTQSSLHHWPCTHETAPRQSQYDEL